QPAQLGGDAFVVDGQACLPSDAIVILDAKIAEPPGPDQCAAYPGGRHRPAGHPPPPEPAPPDDRPPPAARRRPLSSPPPTHPVPDGLRRPADPRRTPGATHGSPASTGNAPAPAP